jgi:hypothetical protein
MKFTDAQLAKKKAEQRKLSGLRLAALMKVRRAQGFAKIAAMCEYISMFRHSDCIAALVPLFEHEPHEVFWPFFATVWPMYYSEFHWNERLFVAMQRVGPHHSINRLPANIIVYRGCSRSRVTGLSWTTNSMTALGFALGHGDVVVPNPVVAVASIKRSEAYWCVGNECGEYHVISRPTKWSIYSEADFDWLEAMYDGRLLEMNGNEGAKQSMVSAGAATRRTAALLQQANTILCQLGGIHGRRRQSIMRWTSGR